MLDLNKLRKKVQDALASETEESLNQWLNGKRSTVLEDYVGEGEVVMTLPSEVSAIRPDERTAFNLICRNRDDNSDSGSSNYAMAA